MKKLTIITICLNEKFVIEKTILSVLNQTYDNYEYIIIDGASTDGSLEIISKYADKIDKIISEKDKGIYSAMNKGIRLSKGEYLLFLNAGDYLHNENLLEKLFQEKLDFDIIYGDMILDYANGKTKLGKQPEQITYKQMYFSTIWHPASIIKRELFTLYGLYDETFKIAGDYEFFIKVLYKHNVSLKYLPLTFSIYNLQGISARPENQKLVLQEKEIAQKRHFPFLIFCYYKYFSPSFIWLIKFPSRVFRKIKRIIHQRIKCLK